MANVVVVGAGVSGLTTALLLSKNPAYNITIVAKHMPGDYDIEYTSPWAGADYLPVCDVANCRYEKNTWPYLSHLAQAVPEAGIHFQTSHVYIRNKDLSSTRGQRFHEQYSPDPWFRSTMPDFRILSSHELPAAMDTGISVTSVCINTAHYLAYLVSQCLKSGCNIKRAVLSHIVDAASLHSSGSPADIIINCTGLLASRLGGVMDDTVIPARGQIVVVRNSPNTVLAPSGLIISVSGTDDADDEACYIMQRAAGGGTVLGGTYQPGRWESQPDADTSVRIMKRAVEICPELVGKDAEGRQRGIESLSIVRQGVGLRPLRKDGVRIEKEKIGESWVVHNYGHAGWGYQGSYGCSEQVVELVEEVLGTKAKL